MVVEIRSTDLEAPDAAVVLLALYTDNNAHVWFPVASDCYLVVCEIMLFVPVASRQMHHQMNGGVPIPYGT